MCYCCWIIAANLYLGCLAENKSLIELSIGNLTGKGLRNYEYNIGSLKYGRESGFSVDKNKWFPVRFKNFLLDLLINILKFNPTKPLLIWERKVFIKYLIFK